MSKIEWTEKTWNPVTGCTKISEGCKNCYAERMAKRLKAMGLKKYRNGFNVTMHTESLCDPFKWKKPCMIFVCSMGDIFHQDVKNGFVLEMFNVMKDCPQHTFQILTKRPVWLWCYDGELPVNVWVGVTVENQQKFNRVLLLKRAKATKKFVSIEPMLGPININLTGIDWVILGGESGPGARPIKIEWIRPIRDQCIDKGIPFFFKQWGGINKKKSGRLLDGREWNEMPRVE